MQKLASFDPYTIEEVEFFVQKKTKYTTLKSIIVSLIILALTVMLNISMVQQLWIPRSELDVISTERKMSQQPFTSNYVCVIAKTLNNTLPNSTLSTMSLITGRTSKTFTLTDNFNTVSEIMNVADGREFRCYDFMGALINDEFYMRLTVDGADDTFDLMFKTYTIGEIMNTQGSNYVYYETVGGGDMLSLSFIMKKIHGVVYDSLLINYDAQQTLGFSPAKYFSTRMSALGYSYIDFQSEFSKPYDTTTEYVITRANIGEILGKLMSWFSIFVLIAAFGVSPILDYNYKVQLCKKLYDNPKLNGVELSVLSYVKYLVCRVRRSLFDEGVLVSSFEQLEKDMDLLNLIKKQAMMKKLIKENQYINMHPIDAQNIILQENTQNSSDLFIGRNLTQESPQNQSPTNQHNHLNPNTNHSQIIPAPLITEPDQQSRQGIIKSWFKSLDASQTSISLISNKVQGYKTSWNTILTLFSVAVVFWFIVFAGLFQMTPSYTLSSILVDEDSSLVPNVTIHPEDILFRANRTLPMYNFVLTAVILDANDTIIENLTLLSGTACTNHKLNLNESTSGWLCLNKSITLYNNGKNNKTKLGLKLTYLGFLAYSVTYIETLFWQYNIVNQTVQKTKMLTKYYYSSSQTYRFDGQAIMYKDQNHKITLPEGVNQSATTNSTGYLWTCNKALLTPDSTFKGISYQITGEFIKIAKSIPTIWDVINTAWGIVVLSFSVFLSKITRYLNVKQREKIIKGEQNENRNDIVAIISTQYKLIYQVFYKELQQVKFFYKTQFEDFGVKER